MTHLHIALFLCDTPHPKVVEAHGDYIPIFNRFLKDAFPSKARLLGGADEEEVTYQVDPYDVVHKMEYPSEDALKKYAGIIMTGSGMYLWQLSCDVHDEDISMFSQPHQLMKIRNGSTSS